MGTFAHQNARHMYEPHLRSQDVKKALCKRPAHSDFAESWEHRVPDSLQGPVANGYNLA